MGDHKDDLISERIVAAAMETDMDISHIHIITKTMEDFSL